jgi:hypothetical protein
MVGHSTCRGDENMAEATNENPSVGPDGRVIQDWTDLGREMWSYLTGRGAAVNYTLVDMTVEVPRDIGPDAPRATWKFDGTLRVTTSDDIASGSDPHRS